MMNIKQTPGRLLSELTRNALTAYLASRAKANTPAASGAAADVPEWRRVQLPYKSVVACNDIRFN